MNVYLRLFLAGSVGAIIGAGIAHYLSVYFGTQGFLLYAWTLFGVIDGSLTASFVYDPKGSIGAYVSAKAKLATLMEPTSLGVNIGSGMKILATCICKVSIFLAFTAVSATFWWLLLEYLSVFDAPRATWSEKFYLGVATSLLTAASLIWWRTMVFASYEEHSVAFQQEQLGSYTSWLAKRFLQTSPFGIAYYILKIAYWTIVMLMMLIGLVALTMFYQMTQCRARTAAMVGAATGVISGCFLWNPLLLGLIGGSIAVVVHFVASRFSELAEVALAEVKDHKVLRWLEG
jgi:hypothetical protein